jgi:hypothetical protein
MAIAPLSSSLAVGELVLVGPGVPPSGRRTLSETTFLQLGGPSAGGLTDQVVALGDVRGPTGGLRVGRGGSREVAGQLVQVPADGVPAVPLAEDVAQPVGLEQPGGGAEDVTDRDRSPEHRGGVPAHRVVGEGAASTW